MQPEAQHYFKLLQGKRVAILGCGFLGGRLACLCSEAGARVWALTRNPATAETLARLPGVQTVCDDIAGDSWHGRFPPRVDFCVDCVGSGAGGLEGYRRSYLAGMRSACAWLASGRAGSFAYTGTTAVYPAGQGETVDESFPVAAPGEDTRESVLRATEETLREGAERAGVRWFVFRLAGLYGPGRHRFLDLVRERSRTLPGTPSHRLNLIHRDDAATALAAAFASDAGLGSQIFNLCDDCPTPRSEVAAWVAGRLGLPVPVFSGEASGERSRASLDRAISNAKARRLLGWAPRYPSFREGYEPLLAER